MKYFIATFSLSFSIFVHAQFGEQIDVSEVIGQPRLGKLVDLDNDGDLDAITCTFFGDISWYSNLDGGTFSPQNPLAEGANQSWIEPVDIDNDNDADIVFLTKEGSIALITNRGSGIFGESFILINSNQELESFKVVDINQDSLVDIIAISKSNNQIFSFLNNGNQVFQEGNTIISAPDISSFTTIDVDNDQDLDLAVSFDDLTDKIVWYENLETHFSNERPIDLDVRRAGVLDAADVNNDGLLDLVYIISGRGGSVGYPNIYFNESQGDTIQFSRETTVQTIRGLEKASLKDINQDGYLDFMTANGSEDELAWYENNGSTSQIMWRKKLISEVSSAVGIDAEDIDNDGDIDILGVSYSDDVISWFENLGEEVFSEGKPISNPISGIYQEYEPNDLDRDGDMDFVALRLGELIWFENRGDFVNSKFNKIRISGVNHYDLKDYDGDGDSDILFVREFPFYDLAWVQNIAPGTFSEIQQLATGSFQEIEVADFDQDGQMDVLTKKRTIPDTLVVLWRDEETVTQRYINRPSGSTRSFHIGDLNNDSLLDIIVITNQYNVEFSINEGNRSFSPFQPLTDRNLRVRDIEIVNLDGLPFPEILIHDENQEQIIYFENLNGSLFEERPPLSVEGNSAINFAVIDVDLDGNPDILTTDRIQSEVSFYRNLGAGDFSPKQKVADAFSASFPVIEDLDFDGDEDICYLTSINTLNIQMNLNNGGNRVNGVVSITNECDGEINGVLPNAILKIEPDGTFTHSDAFGRFTALTAFDSASVALVSENDIYEVCEQSSQIVYFDSSFNSIDGVNLQVSAPLCSKPHIDLSSTMRRRCFRNRTIINYANIGTQLEEEMVVVVELPHFVELIEASHPYNADTLNNQYYFMVGDVFPNEYDRIIITDSVSCANVNTLGISQCTKAWIVPKDQCHPDLSTWDGSDLEVDVSCNPIDSIFQVQITNAGDGLQDDSTEVRFYYSTELVKRSNIQLEYGSSIYFYAPFNQKSFRVEIDQSATNPFDKVDAVTKEHCSDLLVSLEDRGHAARVFDPFDEESDLSVECLPIEGSYDPNDKQVFPAGENGRVNMDTELKYTIRFQNTGSDTAFFVKIVDTLDSGLDISSIRALNASHEWDFTVTGSQNPVLEFSFKNILLPDSATDEINSQGFVSFKISPNDDMIEGTEVSNFADIYFDYNPPIRTNTVSSLFLNIPANLINSDLSDRIVRIDSNNVITSSFQIEETGIGVYPNPSLGELNIVSNYKILQVNVYNDLYVKHLEFYPRNSEFSFEMKELRTGIYFLTVETAKGREAIKIIKE